MKNRDDAERREIFQNEIQFAVKMKEGNFATS